MRETNERNLKIKTEKRNVRIEFQGVGSNPALYLQQYQLIIFFTTVSFKTNRTPKKRQNFPKTFAKPLHTNPDS